MSALTEADVRRIVLEELDGFVATLAEQVGHAVAQLINPTRDLNAHLELERALSRAFFQRLDTREPFDPKSTLAASVDAAVAAAQSRAAAAEEADVRAIVRDEIDVRDRAATERLSELVDAALEDGRRATAALLSERAEASA